MTRRTALFLHSLRHLTPGQKKWIRGIAATVCGAPLLACTINPFIAEWRNPTPDTALSMGDYQEYNGTRVDLDDKNWKQAEWAKIYQRILADNKAELDRALQSCVTIDTLCSPRLLSFKHLITTLKKVRDPLVQMAAVNAWVNTALLFDTHEAAQPYILHVTNRGSVHRTMVQTLKDGLSVCDETAQLKLYALYQLHFAPTDLRYVSEYVVEKDGTDVVPHAVVMVRLKDTNWILNNNKSLPNRSNITLDQATIDKGILSNAVIEDDITHMNKFGQSQTIRSRQVPYNSVNFEASTVFLDPSANGERSLQASPQHAQNAKAGTSPQRPHSKIYQPKDPLILKIGREAARFNYSTKQPPQPQLAL